MKVVKKPKTVDLVIVLCMYIIYKNTVPFLSDMLAFSQSFEFIFLLDALRSLFVLISALTIAYSFYAKKTWSVRVFNISFLGIALLNVGFLLYNSSVHQNVNSDDRIFLYLLWAVSVLQLIFLFIVYRFVNREKVVSYFTGRDPLNDAGDQPLEDVFS